MQLYGWPTVRPVLHNFLPNRLFIYLVIHAFYTQDEGKTMKSLNKGTLWLSTLQTSKKYRITMCFFRSMKGADSVDFNRSYVFIKNVFSIFLSLKTSLHLFFLKVLFKKVFYVWLCKHWFRILCKSGASRLTNLLNLSKD